MRKIFLFSFFLVIVLSHSNLFADATEYEAGKLENIFSNSSYEDPGRLANDATYEEECAQYERWLFKNVYLYRLGKKTAEKVEEKLKIKEKITLGVFKACVELRGLKPSGKVKFKFTDSSWDILLTIAPDKRGAQVLISFTYRF